MNWLLPEQVLCPKLFEDGWHSDVFSVIDRPSSADGCHGFIFFKKIKEFLSAFGLSLVAQMVKKSICNVGDLGSVPGLGRSPGGGHGNPLQYFCLENTHGQRSLAGYWVTKIWTRLSDWAYQHFEVSHLNQSPDNLKCAVTIISSTSHTFILVLFSKQ